MTTTLSRSSTKLGLAFGIAVPCAAIGYFMNEIDGNQAPTLLKNNGGNPLPQASPSTTSPNSDPIGLMSLAELKALLLRLVLELMFLILLSVFTLLLKIAVLIVSIHNLLL